MNTIDINKRLEICNSCEYKVGDVTVTCELCACPLDYITKKENAECPIKKWTKTKES